MIKLEDSNGETIFCCKYSTGQHIWSVESDTSGIHLEKDVIIEVNIDHRSSRCRLITHREDCYDFIVDLVKDSTGNFSLLKGIWDVAAIEYFDSAEEAEKFYEEHK